MVEQRTRDSGRQAEPRREPIFFDDFGSGGLDRSTWNVRITGKVVNEEQQAYVDSPETVYVASGHEAEGADGNVLVIQPRYHPGYSTPEGDHFDFVSGRVDTRERFQFRFGSASARMRLPVGRGLWPAFWLMGCDGWPDTGEIDVMEYVGEPDWVSCAVHGPGYSGEQALVNNWYFTGAADASSWHVYTVDWEPDQLVFKVDGRLAYRVVRPMVDFFGRWAFDNEKFLILNCALGGIYPVKSHGIRSPYYGLSEEAVEAIKTDRAKVLVDWVRVESFDAKPEVA